MPTPKETFELATLKGRIPIGVVAGIAWLESAWNPQSRTGRHVGLYQLVDSPKGSIYGDWLNDGGPKVPTLEDPSANAVIAGWALEKVSKRIRDAISKHGITLPDTVFWPLVYWAWLAGTSDVPRVIAAYAEWVSRDRATSVIPLVRAWQEAEARLSTEGQLWRRYQALQTAERWRPDRIQAVLGAGAIRPQLAAQYVLDKRKAGYASRLVPWVRLSWAQVVDRVGPEFVRLYKRPISSPWPTLRSFGAGAVVGALLLAYLLLRR